MPPAAPVEMVTSLRKCPSLFATTDSMASVMTRLSDDASSLTVCVATADGGNFTADFNEATLTALKENFDKNCSWDKFFADLQHAFNRGADGLISFEPASTSVVCGTAERKLTFKLATTTNKVQESILASLVNYHHIHVHLRAVEKQVEESAKQEEEIRTQAADLEKEEQHLKDAISRNKEQDETFNKRLKELQKQLGEAEEEKRKSGQDTVMEEEDEDSTLCRARIPLRDRDCRDFDPQLLKMVKSGFCDDKELSGDVAFNNVIRPFTSSELVKYTSNLTSKQQQQVWNAMQKIDDWDYDVFALQTAMAGNDTESLATQPSGGSLFVTAYDLFFKYRMMQKFRIDEKIFLNWISVVEAGYHPNPYHNSMHAADVLHITHYILSKGGLAKKCNLSDEDTFAALFAAAIHDYDHPGINNSFHVKAQTYLATLYNDRSILENRHVSSVFELMKLPRYNLLSAIGEDQRRDIRDTIIEMVLATDMGLHGKYVAQFKRRLQENHELVKKDDVRLALAMAVKMADISNCGRPETIYLTWAAKIADEFYMQGDRERNLGMPCSPFMDRMQPAIAKGQIAFMNYIVIPMFDNIAELIPDMRFSVDHAEANKAYWTKNDDS